MKEGDQFPKDVEFLYIPINKDEDALVCSRPIKLTFNKLIQEGNLLIVSIPGAYSPTCSQQHLPDILTNLDKLNQLDIKNIVIYSVNDSFVMNSYGKLLVNKYNITRPIYFASDPNSEFTLKYGLGSDKSNFGMGFRSDRFAMVISKGIVKYLKKDTTTVENSGIKGILTAKL